mmetsp:Transcript_7761/g.12625  ORF Transcript_7761/g.12625 Transcript_7761/m.12625 type:complete len:99 (+) Transcript_7761:234-530(+)
MCSWFTQYSARARIFDCMASLHGWFGSGKGGPGPGTCVVVGSVDCDFDVVAVAVNVVEGDSVVVVVVVFEFPQPCRLKLITRAITRSVQRVSEFIISY